jgi:hypothetical protein
MREVWIAIPHRLKAPKRPGVRVVRMRNIELGEWKYKWGNSKSTFLIENAV